MIGLVTIGQAPRTDVVVSMFPTDAVPQVVEAGALDDVPLPDIHNLRPGTNEHLLVTRLSDGTEVRVAKERLLPFIQAAVHRVEQNGADVVCVLCTGAFDNLKATVPLVFPDRVLLGVVNAIQPGGTLGIVIPHAAQSDSMINKWTLPSRGVVTAVASPYGGYDPFETYECTSPFGRGTGELERQGADLIVMDCMGFDRAMHANVTSGAQVPVILANSLVGAVLLEIFGRGAD